MGDVAKHVAREGSILVLRALVAAIGSIGDVDATDPDEALRLAWRCYQAEEDAQHALEELIESAQQARAEISYPQERQDDRRPFPRNWSSDYNDSVLIAMDRLAQVRNEVRRKRPGWVER